MPTQAATGVTRKAGKHEPVRGGQQAAPCFRLLPQPLSMMDENSFLPELLLPRAFYPRNRMKVGHRARPKVSLTTLTGQTERTEGHSPDRRQQAHFLFILAFKP